MQPARRSHESCTGCSVCLLVCPVWQARRDIRYSPQGIAKALQMDVPAAVLADPVDACTLCGACEPACPEALPLVELTLDLRRALATAAPARLTALCPPVPGDAEPHGQRRGTLLVAAGALTAERARRIARLLEADLAADDGADLVLALESGTPLPDARVERFLRPLRQAQTLVVGNALLLRRLRDWLPAMRLRGTGEALSAQARVRAALGTADFYVVDAAQYHVDQGRLVGHYDRLRQATGCCMNLDLQRMAVASTAGSLATRRGRSGVDPLAQARWILEGADPARVVVEDEWDLAPFAAVAGCPVVHVAELCDD